MSKNIQQVPEKIMIIDDDPFSAMLSKMKLRNIVEEKNISEFYSAENALEILGRNLGKESVMIPDLILLEVMMNNLTGWDFITKFSELMAKHDETEIQLIILTSSQFFSDYRKASKFKAVKGFLIKPFRTEMLMDLYQKASEGNGQVNVGNEVFPSFIV